MMVNFEIKKLIKNKAALGGLIVALVLLVGMFYLYIFDSQLSNGTPDSKIQGHEAVILNQKIAEQHSGTLTDKRINDIINFRVHSVNHEFKKNSFFDPFSYFVADKFIEKNDLTKFYGPKKVSRKGVKILSVNEIGTTIPPAKLKIGNFMPWYQLFELMSKSIILITTLAIYLCASVFSGDAAKKLMPLLLTTKYGRTKQTRAKLLAVFLISTVIFVISEVTTLLIFKSYFSFSGWDTSIQMNFMWNIFKFPIQMNFMQLLLWVLIFQYIGLLFTVLLTSLISSYTKSPANSLSVSLFIFFIPLILDQTFKSGLISKLLNFFPIVNSSVADFVTKLCRPRALLFNHFNLNVAATISFMIMIIIACNILISLNLKNKSSQ